MGGGEEPFPGLGPEQNSNTTHKAPVPLGADHGVILKKKEVRVATAGDPPQQGSGRRKGARICKASPSPTQGNVSVGTDADSPVRPATACARRFHVAHAAGAQPPAQASATSRTSRDKLKTLGHAGGFCLLVGPFASFIVSSRPATVLG